MVKQFADGHIVDGRIVGGQNDAYTAGMAYIQGRYMRTTCLEQEVSVQNTIWHLQMLS